MTAPRKPQAFRIEPEPAARDVPEPRRTAEVRKPRAMKAEMAVVTPAEIDVFDEIDDVADIPPPVEEKPRRSLWLRLFLGAFGILVSLAVGLWTDNLIRTLFERADWLGWFALGVAALAALALVVMLIREAVGLARLASVEKLRGQAEDALARNDPKLARNVVDALSAFVADKPETAAGRRLAGSPERRSRRRGRSDTACRDRYPGAARRQGAHDDP